MEPSRMIAAPNDSLDGLMQFTTNYSLLARDEESIIRRHNIQTTQSTLVGIENPDMSCMPLHDISVFQSRIMSSSTSRLPPEGAERVNRVGADGDADMSNLSDCSTYEELLQLVNKYDLDDISVSDVPDKILPPVGGQSYRDRIKKLQNEGKDLNVPSTEQIIAVTKEYVGLTPTLLYDRIMESINSKNENPMLSESDMDIAACGRPLLEKSFSRRNGDQTFKAPPLFQQSPDPESCFDFSKPNNTLGDSSFVAVSNSILDKDEKSVLEKHGGLAKQVDITCPADQPTLPWNVSNVTLFGLDTTGSLPPRRFENSVRKPADGPGAKTFRNHTSELDDLSERIYALSPSSTSLSAISKIIRDSGRAPRDKTAPRKH